MGSGTAVIEEGEGEGDDERGEDVNAYDDSGSIAEGEADDYVQGGYEEDLDANSHASALTPSQSTMATPTFGALRLDPAVSSSSPTPCSRNEFATPSLEEPPLKKVKRHLYAAFSPLN